MPSSVAPPPRFQKLGRTIVLVTFLSVLIALIVALAGSILTDLFGPPPSAENAIFYREKSWCVRRLSGLRDELSARFVFEAGRLPDAPPPKTPHAEWQRKWQGKYEEAEQGCMHNSQDLKTAFLLLGTLRKDYQGIIEQLAQTSRRTNNSLSHSIKALLPPK